MNRGKLAILGILLLAIALGGFAWWYQYRTSRHALEHWGADHAFRIRYAPEVELVRLIPADEPPTSEPGGPAAWTIDGQMYQLESEVDLSRARGLVHARQALIQDASYEWQEPPPCEAPWQAALLFRRETQQTVLLLDFECRRVRLREARQAAALIPRVNEALRDYLATQ